MQMEVLLGKALPQQPGHHTSIAVIYESGSKLGSLEYHLERDVLKIDRMMTATNYQRIGIGATLFEAVIKMNPQIRQIQTELAEDNDRLFHEALTQHRDTEAAIRKTPAYKIRARLGFTRIVPGSVRDTSWDGSGTYQFAVERP
jgi:GNAT superfamily N-acetyltransferase